MSEEAKKNGIFSGLLWRFGERFAAQGVSFVVSLVLARLLLPEYYGIISIVKVFLVICKAFVQDGLGYALIQKKDADRLDFSTVFYAQMVLGAALYLLVFLVSPVIAAWYHEPILTPVFRVMALNLPIGAVNCVQQSYVSRQMQFKRFFFSTIIGTILSAGIGLTMAVSGMGVWALVAQDLSNLVCDTLILWFTVKWRPTLTFSFARLTEMLRFSWKLLMTTMIDNLYNSLYPIVIGKLFGTVQQGYYDRGDIIPNVIATNVTTAFKSVLLSAYAKQQEAVDALKGMLRRSVRLAAFVLFPLMAGLIAAAKPLTLLLLGEKWLNSVIFLQYCSLFFAFAMILVIYQQAISAVGRSDISLRMEIIKKIVGVCCLLIGLPFGVAGLLAGKAISAFLALVIVGIPNRKLFGYTAGEQLHDLLPSAALSAFMGMIVYGLGQFEFGVLLTLVLQAAVGIGVYLVGAVVFRLEGLRELMAKVRGMFRK